MYAYLHIENKVIIKIEYHTRSHRKNPYCKVLAFDIPNFGTFMISDSFFRSLIDKIIFLKEYLLIIQFIKALY